MTSKQKSLTIRVVLLAIIMAIGSFLLIEHNKKIAINLLEDANKHNASITCENIDAGLLSIQYNNLSIQPKGSPYPDNVITIKCVTIAKTPSLATIVSHDIKQGKTSIDCDGIIIPLTQPMAQQYGTNTLEMNLAASSDVNDRDVTASTVVDIPKVGCITSALSLDVDPTLYKQGSNISQDTLLRNIALKAINVTLENKGGVQDLLTASHIQKNTIAKAERDMKNLSAVDYQADLNSFIEGSKKLSLAFSFPDNQSVPLNRLFLALLFRSSDDPSKIKITSF